VSGAGDLSRAADSTAHRRLTATERCGSHTVSDTERSCDAAACGATGCTYIQAECGGVATGRPCVSSRRPCITTGRLPSDGDHITTDRTGFPVRHRFISTDRARFPAGRADISTGRACFAPARRYNAAGRTSFPPARRYNAAGRTSFPPARPHIAAGRTGFPPERATGDAAEECAPSAGSSLPATGRNRATRVAPDTTLRRVERRDSKSR
jgi:hypothetical protein